MAKTCTEDESLPPSHFANLGQPSCSRWGKSEIEWIALAYVQALVNDGDTWKTLSREQVNALLTDEQRANTYGMLRDDYYQHWFDAVADQITDTQGARGVHGFWSCMLCDHSTARGLIR